jgi:hypothetical protein
MSEILHEMENFSDDSSPTFSMVRKMEKIIALIMIMHLSKGGEGGYNLETNPYHRAK